MALITCKYCGQEVSDKAIVCPHCSGKLTEESELVKEELDIILCEECGSEIPKGSQTCSKCGCPIHNAVPVRLPSMETVAETVAETKKLNPVKVIAIAAAAVAVIFLIFGGKLFGGGTLRGDDKIAYELIVESAHWFKDPSSVRFVSGSLAVDKSAGWFCLSAKNGFGGRGTDRYYVSDGYAMPAEDLGEADNEFSYNLYFATDELDAEKINKQLEKALGSGG